MWPNAPRSVLCAPTAERSATINQQAFDDFRYVFLYLRKCVSVIAEPDRHHGVATKWVLHELLVTFGAKIVAATMSRLIRLGSVRKFFFIQAFQNLMQFRQMIDVIFCCGKTSFLGRLNFNLNNVSSLVRYIDLTLTAIAGVVDHPKPFLLRENLADVIGNNARPWVNKK